MKKFLVILSVLVFAAALTAQVRTGNIYGKITDSEGNPLPGVSLTLTGPQMAALTTVTGAAGIYRFVSISPGNAYGLAAELSGFKKTSKTGIIVQLGSNVEMNLIMEVGTIEEQVTVVAQTPIVDTKKTTVGQNIDREAMQSLPSARDPWVVMQLAPSIMVDRENVGGNESGQQSGFIGKGDTSAGRISGNQGANNIWSVDGIDITDPSALGGSALYYDFDMFEEMNVTTGGAADVSIQTGGIALNMVTRRGGNKMSLAGRFYLTDQFFQSDNMSPELLAQGVLDTNKIVQVKDFGFNVGGPILKDKLWFWGAYGVQDIFVYTLPTRTGIGVTTPAQPDKSLLNNYNFKINAQLLANNRFEALVTSGAKEKFGRDASPSSPEGNHQTGKYHWGSPIVKLQDEHVFGNNFYLSLKYSFNDAGFGWRPIPDEQVQYPIVTDQTLAKYVPYASGMNASWGSYGVSRPRNNYQLQGTYFNDTFLGASHEIKFGAEYAHKIEARQSDNTASIQGFSITRNYNTLALDANADGTRTTAEMAGWQNVYIARRDGANNIAQQWAAYIQDTMVKGNFTLTLGLRFDKQWSGGGLYTRDAILYRPDPAAPYLAGEKAWEKVFDPSVSATLDPLLPSVEIQPVKGTAQIVNGTDRPYQWNTFSPRIGLTWDVTGDGKTVAKLALSQYGDVMGVGWYQASPYGTGGNMSFWWNDGNGVTANKDGKMQFNEMYWNYSSRQPVANPLVPGLPYRYVPYRVFDDNGVLMTTATNMLADRPSVFDSDAYYAGNVGNYNWFDPTFVDYEFGVTTYFLDRKAQSDSRTREILLTLEREISTDLSVAVNFTYRKFDNSQISLRYYPAEHAVEYPGMWGGTVDPVTHEYVGPEPSDIIYDPRTPPAGGWYVQAGTIPDTYHIGGTYTGSVAAGYTWSENAYDPITNPTGYLPGDPRRGQEFSSGDAAGRPYYLPGPNYSTTSTRYNVIRKADNYFTYTGVDLVVNKRLSNKWFMNGSVTWQAQKTYWGTDFFNPTNQWAFDGQAYGDWGGAASGKQAVLMYTRWMAKLSGMYQLPYGFNISGTFNAREGWKVPQYFTLDNFDAPNYAQGHASTIYKQTQIIDSLPMFWNVTLRLEKKINVGQGRMYLMADVFNLFNNNMPIRSFPKNDGRVDVRNAGTPVTSQAYTSTVYNYNGLLNEILNPRIWRFGARFEF